MARLEDFLEDEDRPLSVVRPGQATPGEMTPEAMASAREQLIPGSTYLRYPETLLPAAGALAASVLVPEAAPAARGILPWISRSPAVLEGAGAGAGEFARESVRQLRGAAEGYSPTKILGTAIGTMAGSKFVRSLLGGTARAIGGVARRIALEPTEVPAASAREVMRKGPSYARAAELADDITRTAQRYVRRLTPMRQVTEKYLEEADARGVKASLQPTMEAIVNTIDPNAATTEATALNTRLWKMYDNLSRIEANRGGLTASEMDSFISGQLDEARFRASGDPKDSIYADAIAKIRPAAKAGLDKLMVGLGKGQRVVPSAAKFGTGIQKDRLREIEDTFDKSPEQVINSLRNAFRQGGEHKLQLLHELSAATGRNFVAMARSIFTRKPIMRGVAGPASAAVATAVSRMTEGNPDNPGPSPNPPANLDDLIEEE